MTLAALLLMLGFWAQNLAEWRGGGPDYPQTPLTRRLLPPPQPTTRAAALILVSLVIPAALALALMIPGPATHPLLVMIGAALAANALMQGTASLVARRRLPGTRSGLALMLPTALWLIAVVPASPGAKMIWGAAGVAATPLILLPIWWLAAAITRR